MNKSLLSLALVAALLTQLVYPLLYAGILTPEWRAAWRKAAVDPSGDLPREVAAHLRHMRGLTVDPTRNLITAGARDGLALVLRTLGTAPRGAPHRHYLVHQVRKRHLSFLQQQGTQTRKLKIRILTHSLILEQYRTGIGLSIACNNPQNRGLTGTISPQQRDGLTFVDGQGDIVHDGGGAIAAGGMGKL